MADGGDSGMIDFKKGFISQGEVIDRARREDVMIYAVGLRSVPSQWTLSSDPSPSAPFIVPEDASALSCELIEPPFVVSAGRPGTLEA